MLQAVSWYRSTAARGILLGASLGTALLPASYAFEKESRRERATGVGTMKLAAVIFCGACLVTAAVESRQRLWVAAYEGDLDTVRAELAKGADVNQPLESNTRGVLEGRSSALATGATPLMGAIMGERPEVVKVLVAHGADLAARDDKGWTPMHCVIGQGDADEGQEMFDIFSELVSAHAADPRALINAPAPGASGATPLHHAVFYGSKREIRWLLDMGGDPAALAAQNRALPSYALDIWLSMPKLGFDRNKIEGMAIIDILLGAGLDVDMPGAAGRTALATACLFKRPDVVGLFASRGADPARASKYCYPYRDLIGRVAAVVAEGRFSRAHLDDALVWLDDTDALHSVSEDDDGEDLIEPLLALGYTVDAFSECCGVQPLHIAAKYGNTAVAEVLLRVGADVNAVATRGSKTSDDEGQRPLDIALEVGNSEVAALLVRHGGTINLEGLSAWQRQGSTLDDPLPPSLATSLDESESMALSVISNEIAAVGIQQAMLESGELERVRLPSQSVLHLAVLHSYGGAVRDLLKLGALPAAVKDGSTPLHEAARSGRASMVEILAQNGADVDTLSAKNETALCVAVDRGYVRTTKAFLRLGANPNVVCHEGHTPLIVARKASIVDALIQHGADVNARDTTSDFKGCTALLFAGVEGNVDVVRSLLKAGADVEAKCNVGGDTPLYGAAVNNYPRVVEALLARGAEVSPVNDDGWTPLATAAANGHVKVVKALLKAGADPRQRLGGGALGRNSVEWATENGHSDVVAAMTEAAKAANPWRYYLNEWEPVVVAVLVILVISWVLPRIDQWRRSQQAVEATRDLLREDTAREPRRRNRNAQAARDREAAARRREQERRDREAAAREAREHTAVREQVRLDREAAAEAAEAARSREAAAVRAREDEMREREAAAAREQEARDREAAAEAARAALDREAAAREREAREREAWERENLDSLQAMAAWAAASEEKSEEPLGREESKEEPPVVPAGFEIVARVLEHLGEPHLLPIFEAEEINDKTLPDLDPTDLIGLGVSQMTCLAILGAAHSAAKTKKLEAEEVLDNVARHQSVLEEELREHRAEIARLRIRELPQDLCCPVLLEIMKDPVQCVGDGHTYERVAIEQWLERSNISPMTNQPLETTQLVPNHMARKLIGALLEEHRGRAAD